MVLQSCIIDCLKMYKISGEVIKIIENTMRNWTVELTAGGKSLSEVKIQRGILQGYALFVIAMMPLNHISRKCTGGYKPHKQQEKNGPPWTTSNCLPKLEILILAVQTYSQDIRMESDIEKCAMLIIKSGKQQMTRRIERLNQEKIRTLGEKETYKYLGILKADTTKRADMKEKFKKEYLRKTRTLLETKLHSRIHIKGINIWAAPIVS